MPYDLGRGNESVLQSWRRRRKGISPEQQFDRAARRLGVFGYAGVGLTALFLFMDVIPLVGDRSGHYDGQPALRLLILTPLSLFIIRVSFLLRRGSPLARKTAAVLAALGMAGVTCLFLLEWIGLFQAFNSGIANGMALSSFALGGFAIAIGLLCVGLSSFLMIWVGWRFFRASEYFAPDEAKKFCGETGTP